MDEDDLGEDTDADGVHNACDNCLQDRNPGQADSDDDRVGNTCDNCRSDRNPSQSDLDGDFEGDICDIDDGLIYIRFHEPLVADWDEEMGFDTWNSYRGDLDILKGTGVYTQVPGSNPIASQSCGLTGSFVDDPGGPGRGKTAFFLTTGVTSGVEPGLGDDGSGMPRPNANPCP